ncbi:gnat family [Diplodia corticola]|uniref:Gnat family n=1 Tax=Diplodia corticola TaxID=236234 RepID=A0A1J9RXP7_9PEZI|nr:gnat family [Diplodia corticola]OJD32253.1 gnat family [Diplodia corticola]
MVTTIHHDPTTTPPTPYLKIPLPTASSSTSSTITPASTSTTSSTPSPNRHRRFTHVLLTPPRRTDGPAAVAALNDPRVYLNLLGPAYPYDLHHWEAWYASLAADAARAAEELRGVEEVRRDGKKEEEEGRKDGKRWWVGSGLPFPVIRGVVDGEEGEKVVFLGKVNVRRADYRTVRDEGERRRLREANAGLGPGEEAKIEWEMGFWLCPEAQGQGIMTTVLRTLLEGFFVDYMNIHNLKGSFLAHNKGSRRVFEKCGFVFESEEVDAFEVVESKTGGVKGVMVNAVHTRWKR